MTETTTLRLSNPDSDGKNQYESPDVPSGQVVCASYMVDAMFGGEPPEFLAFEFPSENASATLTLDRTTKNYAVYEHDSGAITGLYVSRDSFEERDAPETLDVRFEPSSEAAWQEVQEAADAELEEAASGILADD